MKKDEWHDTRMEEIDKEVPEVSPAYWDAEDDLL